MKINNKFLKSSLVISLIAVMMVTALVVIPKAVLADDESIANLTYSAHVQDLGDECQKGAVSVLPEEPSTSTPVGTFAGTVNEFKRMEAFKIDADTVPEGVTIKYRAHVKDLGWQEWKSAGEEAGTRYEGKRMEALQLVVTGLEDYDVYYRAHVQDIGWQGWVKALSSEEDGGVYPMDPEVVPFAGTVGQLKRMEAIEIAVLSRSLVAAKDEAAKSFEDFVENSDLKKIVPGSEQDYASTVSDAIAEGYTMLNDATTVEEVNTALESAEAGVLDALKDNLLAMLETVYNNGKAYYDMILTEEKYNFFKGLIEEATSINDAIFNYEYALSDRYSLSEKQDQGVSDLSAYLESQEALKRTVPGSDVDYLSVIADTVQAENDKIRSAETVEAVEEAVEAGKKAVLEALRSQVKYYLDTIYNNGEAYGDKVLTDAKYNAYLSGIEGAETFEDIINAYENAERERYSLSEKVTEWVNKLTDFVEQTALKDVVLGSDMDFAAVPDINTAIVDGYALVNQAKSAEEAEAAYNTAVENVLAEVKEYTKFLLDEIYNNGLGYEFGESNSRLVLTDEQYEYYTKLLAEATTVDEAIHGYEDAVNNRREITDFNLYSAQKRAKETLAKYKDPANYTVNKEAYDAAIKAGNDAIDTTTTVEGVQAALADAKNALDAVLDDTAEAKRTEKRRNECVNILTQYVEASKLKTIIPGGEMDFAAVPQINEEIANGYANINAATTYDEVTLATRAARDKIVVATKDYVKYLLGVVYNEGAAYYDLVLSKEAYDNAINEINAVNEKDVKSCADLDKVIDAYLSALNGRANIDSLRTAKKEEFKGKYETALDNVVPGNKDSKKYIEVVEGLTDTIEAAEAAIDEATSEGAINTIIENAYADLLKTLKAYVQDSLKTLVDSIEIYEYDYNTARDAVNGAEDLQTVVDAFKTAYDKRIKTVATAEALTEALKDFDNVAIASEVTIVDELETLSEDKTVKINAGAKMKVTGKLSADHLTIEGEGTVELANETEADNGANLVNAVKAGAGKVVVSENAKASEIVEVNSAEEELTVELAEGKTIESSSSTQAFAVSNGGSLTISGNGETSVIKNTTKRAIQNLNGTLTVKDVKIEAEDDGIFVGSSNSTTTLTNVSIKSNSYGFNSNSAESPDGIGTVTLKDCNIGTVDSPCEVGAYLPAGGNVTIDGGTIVGGSAIVDKGANLTLTGNLKLIGTDTRNTSKRVSERIVGAQAYWNGTPLLIVSQKAYSDGKEITVNIGDNVTFAYQGDDAKHYDVEIVGANDATESLGAKLVINYTKITNDTLETDGSKFKPDDITKSYFLDKGTSFTGTITINGETK